MKSSNYWVAVVMALYAVPLFLLEGPLAWADLTINSTTINATTANATYNDNTLYLAYVRYMTYPLALQLSGNDSTWLSGNATLMRAADNPIQKEIYFQMANISTDSFVYSNSTAAFDAVLQRMATISTLDNFNANHQYTYWSSAHPPSTTAPNWTTGSNTTVYFVETSHTNQFIDVANLCSTGNTTYGECYGAIIASIWNASSMIYGSTAFNAKYSIPGYGNLNMDYTQSISGRPYYTSTPSDQTGDVSSLVPGDFVAFKNYNYDQVISNLSYFQVPGHSMPDQPLAPLTGSPADYYWTAENALYRGGGRFAGLGLGLGNLSIDDMKADIAAEYNSEFGPLITLLSGNGGYDGNLSIISITGNLIDARITIPAGTVRRLRLP